MINLKQLEGVWENPTWPTIMIIQKSDNKYIIIIMFINENTQQASPSVYDIEEEDGEYYFGGSYYRQKIDFEPCGWRLILSKFGSYYPN